MGVRQGNRDIRTGKWIPGIMGTLWQGHRNSETELLEKVEMGMCTHKYSYMDTS